MKKLRVEKLTKLSIDFREHVLLADIVEKSSNGVWIENSFGERDFICNTQLRSMAQFLLKVAAYETESYNV